MCEEQPPSPTASSLPPVHPGPHPTAPSISSGAVGEGLCLSHWPGSLPIRSPASGVACSSPWQQSWESCPLLASAGCLDHKAKDQRPGRPEDAHLPEPHAYPSDTASAGPTHLPKPPQDHPLELLQCQGLHARPIAPPQLSSRPRPMPLPGPNCHGSCHSQLSLPAFQERVPSQTPGAAAN